MASDDDFILNNDVKHTLRWGDDWQVM
jgi:hypothetical protein